MLPLVATLLAATALRIYLIARDSVPFTYDMGRDLLWAKDIVFYQTPTLIGPAASIWGVYFGPLWFYFLGVPLAITGGHPIWIVYATAVVILATGILSYFLFKKILGSFLSLVLAILILFSGTLINISTFAFHANVLPLLTLLMIYFCYLAIIKKPIYIALAAGSVSLMFHADPAPAVVATFILVATIIFFKLFKSKDAKSVIFFSTLAYLIPFSPQILFELRNGFIQTKSLIAYFLGQNPSLSGQLPFFERVVNRASVFFDFFKNSMAGQNQLASVLLLTSICLGIYFFVKSVKDKNIKKLFYLNLLSFVIFFLMFWVVITPEVKVWYLYGMPVIFATTQAMIIYPFLKYKALIFSMLALFVLINILPFMTTTRKSRAQKDPATLANQISAIDLIYSDAKSDKFSVYVFTPSIYDHHYQYLFWWQGIRLGKGLPQDFAYLPNQPEYVRNKEFYTTTGEKSNLLYLIIENAPENQFYTRQNWLTSFADYKVVWEKDINNALILQKRQK